MAERYFWQMIFIKFTPDNKRVFYPHFFSDGYFITSEDQMIKYRKYGNMFFLIAFAIFLILGKLKILKLLIKMNILNIWGWLGVLGAIILLGIIYNIIIEKKIFGHSIKIEEKYWVNNGENIQFILTTTLCILGYIAAIIGVTFFGITYFSNFLPVMILIGIGLVIALAKGPALLMKRLNNYTLKLEIKALTSFAQYEIEKLRQERFSEKANSWKIIENIQTYMPYLIEYLAENENISYESELLNIKKFIKDLKQYNVLLYNKEIDESTHAQLIEEKFLSKFSLADN